MKQMKAKLVSAIVMLVVAAVMMSTVSYAWFTISTAPEVSDITANVCANGNLEIALDGGSMTEPAASSSTDAGKNTTWGNIIDLEAAFKSTSGSSVTLRPVQVTLDSTNKVEKIQAPTFGKDGRISGVADTTRTQASNGSADNFKDMGGVWYFTTASSSAISDAWAIEVDYWLRSNVEGTVSLQEDGVDRGAGEAGLGSYITDHRVTVMLVDTSDGTEYKAVPVASGSAITSSGSSVTIGTKCSLKLQKKDTSGSWVDASIPLTKNTAKAIRMYVYFDGAALTNADFINEVKQMTMNIQFKHSETLTDLGVDGTNYGRDTANGGSN